MTLVLPELSLLVCEFYLQLAKACTLPQPLGATLRGGLALLHKRSVCLHPHFTHCRDCPLLQRCVYPALFEPAPPPDSTALSTHQDVPLGVILRLPSQPQAHYTVGDTLTFGLVLVGAPVRHLSYLVAAVEHLGQSGLGPERVRFRLEQVLAHQPHQEPQPVYMAGLMYRAQAAFTAQQLQSDPTVDPTAPISTLTLHFLTPTRLKYAEKFIHDAPPFHVLIRTLLRRVSSLSYFHGGQRWETDYRGWIERAEAVTTSAAAVEWHDGSRYSTRTQRRMPLGGLVGTVTYSGDLTPFLPLLRLGELIHVGKNAVFGNGRFVIADC